MAYLLIYDLDGRNNIRRKINRYLKCHATMVQRSVWRFTSMPALRSAAGMIRNSGGKVLAFAESDRIFLSPEEVERFLLCLK